MRVKLSVLCYCCVGLMLGEGQVHAADMGSEQDTLLAATSSMSTTSTQGHKDSLETVLKGKPEKEQAAIKSLDNALYAANAFASNFSQEVYNDQGEVLAKSSGIIALKRPMNFIMNTTSPDRVMLYLKDGDIYYYDEAVAQVSIYSMDRLKDNPFLLLIEQKPEVWQDFTVSQDEGRFTLVPKLTQDIRSLTLSFAERKVQKSSRSPDKVDATILESLTIRMNDGTTNFYRLFNHKLEVTDSSFLVKLPADVEYTDERI